MKTTLLLPCLFALLSGFAQSQPPIGTYTNGVTIFGSANAYYIIDGGLYRLMPREDDAWSLHLVDFVAGSIGLSLAPTPQSYFLSEGFVTRAGGRILPTISINGQRSIRDTNENQIRISSQLWTNEYLRSDGDRHLQITQAANAQNELYIADGSIGRFQVRSARLEGALNRVYVGTAYENNTQSESGVALAGSSTFIFIPMQKFNGHSWDKCVLSITYNQTAQGTSPVQFCN